MVDILIPRNTPLPCERTKTYATLVDRQLAMKIEVLQGEDEDPEFCQLLGEAIFAPLPPYPRGSPIEITFAYDRNGVIQVTARDPQTDQQLNFKVESPFRHQGASLEWQRQLVHSRRLEG